MITGKKKEIIDCTIELCSTKPIKKITVNEICEKSGITRNTFYYHFHDIYDVLDTMIGEHVSVLGNCTPADVDKSLFDVIEATVMYKKVWKNLYKTIGQEQMQKYIIGRLHGVFLNYIENKLDGRKISELDLGIICAYFEEALFGVLVRWIRGESKGDTPDEMLEISNRIRIIFTGILDIMIDNASNS